MHLTEVYCMRSPDASEVFPTIQGSIIIDAEKNAVCQLHLMVEKRTGMSSADGGLP